MAKIPTSFALETQLPSPGKNVIAFDRQDRINIEEPGRDIARAGPVLAKAGEQIFGGMLAAQNEADDYEVTKTLIGFQRDAERKLDEEKRNMVPGGDGFADQFKGGYDALAQDTFAAAKERKYGPATLKKLDSKLLEWGERFHTKAWHAELDERDRFHIEDVQKSLLDFEGRVQESPDRVQEHIAAARQLIGSSRIPIGKRDSIMRRLPAQLEQIAARVEVEKDPERAIQRLQMRPKGDLDAPAAPAGGASTIEFIKQQEGDKDAGWDVRQFSGPYGVKRGEKERLTPQQAEARLLEEVAPIEKWIDSEIKTPLAPDQRTALVSLFYNIGMDKGRPEQVAKLINDGQLDKVPDWIKQYTRDRDGKELDGLVARRGREADLFAAGAGKAPLAEVKRGELPAIGESGSGTTGEEGQAAVERYQFTDQAPFRHLPFVERQKLLNVARVALRNKLQSETANDLELIRNGKEPVVGPDGRSSLDRAGQVMTKNQHTKLLEQVEEAKLEARVVLPLRRMNQDQAIEHITKNLPDADEGSETFRRNTRVMEKAERAWKRTEEARKRDLALTLEREPEMIAARNEIAKEKGRITPEAAHQRLVDARLALQEKIGIPSYERKIITRAEAGGILQMPDPKGLDEGQIEKHLRAGAERALKIYGPVHGPTAFREAIGYKLAGDKYKDVASDTIIRAVKGQPVTADDVRRLKQSEITDRIWFGEREPSFPSVDASRPAISPFAAPSMSRDAQAWNGGNPVSGWLGSSPNGTQQWRDDAVKGKAVPAVRQPTDAHMKWLMADPEKRRAVFDREFGAGSTARVLKQAGK